LLLLLLLLPPHGRNVLTKGTAAAAAAASVCHEVYMRLTKVCCCCRAALTAAQRLTCGRGSANSSPLTLCTQHSRPPSSKCTQCGTPLITLLPIALVTLVSAAW
jgi:hypothetical protein